MGPRADDRTLSAAGWSLAGLTLLLFATTPLSMSGRAMERADILDPTRATDLWGGLVVAGFVLSGAVLVQARPRNPIGWLMLVSGVLQCLTVALGAYGMRALTDPAGALPLGLPALWIASWAWIPSLLLPALVLPALYPTGRSPGRLWTLHLRVTLVGIALEVLLAATVQENLAALVRGARLPWAPPAWWVWAVGVPTVVLLATSAATVVVGTAVRAIRARSPERQQLLWLLGVVCAMFATVFSPSELLFALAYGLVPVALTVGVLRYRLLGIEVVLRRTLFYLPITLFVAFVVGGLTTTLARLVPQRPLPLLAASGVVAVVVIPVAGRLSVIVDRFVRGPRPDPLDVVDRVGAELEVAQDDPVPSMLEAVAVAAGSSHASVHNASGQEVARFGSGSSAATLDIPLRHRAVHLGVVKVGPRSGEPRVTPRDARLLLALAPHLAVVVAAQRLTAELALERERVTAATLAERDRLRRDLHDGLGPSLSGIALGLQAAALALERDAPVVPALLERVRVEAESAVREIRRVVDGLRPAALDERGLGGAVADTAAALGLGGPGGPAMSLTVDVGCVLPPFVEETAFRILAESLTNVARHSSANNCAVAVEFGPEGLSLTVADDGVGLDESGSLGHGLASIRQRALDLGGQLTVSAEQPHGTRVTALLPADQTPADQTPADQTPADQTPADQTPADSR